MKITKALVTTRVDNYFPELCAYTIPNLKRYAERIGADFFEITERKSPDLYPSFEKLQVYDYAQHYDKTILIDADIMLSPEAPDFTESYNFDEIAMWMQFLIHTPEFSLWNPFDSKYFIKDGRNIGIVGALTGCSKYTCDLFKPISKDFAKMQQDKIFRPAIIDEFCMSYNLAKYSYKWKWIPSGDYIYHAEMTTLNPKDFLDRVKEIDAKWR